MFLVDFRRKPALYCLKLWMGLAWKSWNLLLSELAISWLTQKLYYFIDVQGTVRFSTFFFFFLQVWMRLNFPSVKCIE